MDIVHEFAELQQEVYLVSLGVNKGDFLNGDKRRLNNYVLYGSEVETPMPYASKTGLYLGSKLKRVAQ